MSVVEKPNGVRDERIQQQQTEVFYIDSDKRLNGTSSSFSFQMNIPRWAKKVAVLQATIPKSYYLVEPGYNVCTLQEEGKTSVVTLPIGNYTALTFINVLVPILNAASVSMGHSYTYAIAYQGRKNTEAETGKYIFTVIGNTLQPSFTFPIDGTLYRQFGFERGSTISFVSSTLTSINVIDFNLVSSIYIHSDLIIGGHGQQTGNSVLQEILAGNEFDFSKISFYNLHPVLTAKPINLHSNIFHFYIVDDDGFTLDLNGHQVNFSLLVLSF
jgi:hypothetical protein